MGKLRKGEDQIELFYPSIELDDTGTDAFTFVGEGFCGACKSRRFVEVRMAILADHCSCGNLTLALDALERGADPNDIHQGQTALGYAVRMDHTVPGVKTFIEKLLSSGANPDGVASSDPPLAAAARAGRLWAVKRLLDAGASPRGQDGAGRSIFMEAVLGWNLEVVDLMLSALERESLPGVDIVRAIVYEDHKEVQEQLKKHRELSSVALEGVAPLALAVMVGNTRIIADLIDAGADPNLGSSCGITPLILASEYASVQVGKVLLKLGADPNLGEGTTALMRAVLGGSIAWVKVLLAAGARPRQEEINIARINLKEGKRGAKGVVDLISGREEGSDPDLADS